MHNKVLIFFLLFFLDCFCISAQTNKIEILKTSFYNASTPAQKLDAALNLCDESYSLNIDSLYYYANYAEQTAIALHDERKKILADVYIESWFGRKNLFDTALKICDADLRNMSYDNNGDLYAKQVMQKCYMIVKSNRHKLALEESFHFLQEAEAHGDTVSQIYGKTMIGTVYRNMQQTDMAMQWFTKAEQTGSDSRFEKEKNEFGVYFLKGMMYNWKANDEAGRKNIESDSLMSVYYLDKSIDDSRKYENLGVLARSLCIKSDGIEDPKKLSLAGDYQHEALRIYNSLHDTLSLLNSMSSLSNYYMSLKQPEKGIATARAAIEIIKRGNAFPIIDFYGILGQCYKAAGKFDKYADVLDTMITLQDSVYKKNSERDLADLNAKYEDQKKENTIIQQKLDIAAKRNTTYVISILSGILFISIIFLYRYYNRRQKQQQQNERLAISAAEEAERKRISADLHDNIGAYAAAAASTIATLKHDDAQSNDSLSLLSDNVQSMITQLNDSIWALNKKAVYLTGISDRFKLFAQKLERAYPAISLTIEEQIEYDRILSPFQTLHLFRIMQEALNNALRHSKCSHVIIHIFSDENFLKISVEDDGVGMLNTNLNGNGINNLKMRAQESGWQAEWEKNEKGGTTVIITST